MIYCRFVPTIRDFIKPFHILILNKRWSWLVLAVFLLVQLFCVRSTFSPEISGSGFISYLPIGLVATLGFFLFFGFFVFPIIIGNLVVQESRLNGPILYTINDEQIVLSNQISAKKFDWASLLNVIESKDYYFCFFKVSSVVPMTLPKRGFTSIDDEQAFRNLVDAKASKDKRKYAKEPYMTLAIIVVFNIIFLFCAFVTPLLLCCTYF